jgi:glycine/D-amino acid oxidase-like deaminating enzyme
MKAIVVGAGVIGASAAYRLAQAGADVTLIEAGRVGGGTSSVTYAWVNACEKLTSHNYFKLNFAGRKAHEDLLEEFPDADWFPRPGVLQWRDAEAEAGGGKDGKDPLEKLQQLIDWGYPAELLALEDVRRLEPDVNPDIIGNAPVIYYPRDGWLYGVPYAAALVGAAVDRHGAQLVKGAVKGLLVTAGRCDGVKLATGEEIQADVVVNCTGRWSNDVVDGAPYEIPLKPTVGLVGYTPPAPSRVRHGLRTPSINMRPDGGGRFFLRSNALDPLVGAEDDPVPTHVQAQELLKRAQRTVPSISDLPVEAVRIAIRPVPRDSYSAVGTVPNLSNYYVAVTHSGITLSAFLGQVIADEVVHGKTRDELADFRPVRFFN